MQSKVEQRVKAANRQFYDAVADHYEEVDGRRSPVLEAWLRRRLSWLRRYAPGGRLLDLGTGSGFVTRCARGIFALRIGVDLSARILIQHQTAFDGGMAADVDALPFAAQQFDVVTCFAVLHHLYTFDGLVAEVARVLRTGGIFYSDHDMNAAFYRRFRLPLTLYRRLWYDARTKYHRVNRQITPELYRFAEWQEEGIEVEPLVRLLEEAGFSVMTTFHWFGLTPITDTLFGQHTFTNGWAPLLSVIAVKGSRIPALWEEHLTADVTAVS